MRLLHTMIRVGDLERSIGFYTEVLGMKLLRRSENPKYEYTGLDGQLTVYQAPAPSNAITVRGHCHPPSRGRGDGRGARQRC